MCFRIASEKLIHIAGDLGVCDSNPIAHRGCIVRFGPLRAETTLLGLSGGQEDFKDVQAFSARFHVQFVGGILAIKILAKV